jgi:hypothetical protein
MRFLGKLYGTGTLASGDEKIGPAEYELDGYLRQPGAVVASGELRMAPEKLAEALHRRGLRLLTTDGRALTLRITGKPMGDAVHIDIDEGLPPEREWRR